MPHRKRIAKHLSDMQAVAQEHGETAIANILRRHAADLTGGDLTLIKQELMPLVVVLEDNHNLLHLIKIALHEANFRVLGADDADYAIELCERHRPAIAMFDVKLRPGGVSGLDAAVTLRARMDDPPLIALWSASCHVLPPNTVDVVIPKTMPAEDIPDQLWQILCSVCPLKKMMLCPTCFQETEEVILQAQGLIKSAWGMDGRLAPFDLTSR